MKNVWTGLLFVISTIAVLVMDDLKLDDSGDDLSWDEKATLIFVMIDLVGTIPVLKLRNAGRGARWTARTLRAGAGGDDQNTEQFQRHTSIALVPQSDPSVW